MDVKLGFIRKQYTTERQLRKRGLREGVRIDEGNERGRDGTGHGRSEGKRVGRKRAEDGLSEEGREHGSKGERETSREVVY